MLLHCTLSCTGRDSCTGSCGAYAWALLLARIYEVFPLTWLKCGGAIRKSLQLLSEPIAPPKLAPARGPPRWKAAGQGDAGPLTLPIPEFEFDQRIAW